MICDTIANLARQALENDDEFVPRAREIFSNGAVAECCRSHTREILRLCQDETADGSVTLRQYLEGLVAAYDESKSSIMTRLFNKMPQFLKQSIAQHFHCDVNNVNGIVDAILTAGDDNAETVMLRKFLGGYAFLVEQEIDSQQQKMLRLREMVEQMFLASMLSN
jgi:hypothetical protein